MRNLFSDFKKFLLRGNVLDLAVAVVVGAAFNAVVQSFANDVLMAIIGAVFGKPNFNKLVWEIGKGEVKYGAFITAVINFVIIALAVFIAVKTFERLQSMRARSGEEEEAVPMTVDQELLAEIRDLLREPPRS
jgi:large conductance mechanosensitive channel